MDLFDYFLIYLILYKQHVLLQGVTADSKWLNLAESISVPGLQMWQKFLVLLFF